MNWTDIIVAAVAAYGAVLSTISIIIQKKRDNPSLRVTLAPGFLTYSDGKLSPPSLILSAGNSGFNTITFTSVGLVLPDNRKLIFTEPNSDISFPCELNPSKGCTVWKKAHELAASFKEEGYFGTIKVRAYFSDAVGNSYLSKAYKFNIEEWIKKD